MYRLLSTRTVLPALAAFATMVVATLAASAASTGAAVTYINEKYGFTLSLPADIFTPGEPRNPDQGGLWNSRDGQARLIAVATANESGDTLSSYRSFVMQQSYKSAIFDYTPVRDTWFVLSGKKDDRIFYERITFACGGRYIYGWQLEYPAAEKKLYDRVVEQIHRSFKPGRGENGRCGRTP